ncbi:hypothetical protein K7640_10690 [Micromonospora sp. PLK6-60]|uniref:hypothetical protein n=1 Tax=Micromonospora sp. PLK6-60 TaxID=2873383 RepID=UPI001CA660FD|nr:hypothetical protein [Micromonospora sp. PLK6-60]MBY8872306.1 hypothetical protein [Micromonospora sp. PLK6-60]
MFDAVVAGWLCLGLGLLFLLSGAQLVREERRRGRRPLPGESFSGRELLWQGTSIVLLGTGNLVGGDWTMLAVPALVILPVVVVRVALRQYRRHRSRSRA